MIEFYHQTFPQLVRLLGLLGALKKVGQYQRLSRENAGCATYVVHECRLLESFETIYGDRVVNELNEHDYPADWDRGIISLLDREFSVFGGGIKYKKSSPPKPINTTLRKLYQKITTSTKLKQLTEKLRAEQIPQEQRRIKERELPYAAISGKFSGREDADLLLHSGLICVDLDYLGEDLERVRAIIIVDPATVLCFVSPRGNGLKVVYQVDIDRYTQEQWYKALSARLIKMCELPPQAVDRSCKNVSRACFLAYDPECFINPNLL